jgi:hypothetical protein
VLAPDADDVSMRIVDRVRKALAVKRGGEP